jgi:hypothetical protein
MDPAFSPSTPTNNMGRPILYQADTKSANQGKAPSDNPTPALKDCEWETVRLLFLLLHAHELIVAPEAALEVFTHLGNAHLCKLATTGISSRSRGNLDLLN